MTLPRPEGPPSGYQKWRDLLFVHWAVDVDALRARVPAPLALDLWEGRAYVGVVPFAMQDVRPAKLPRLFAMDFLETNVRTYVRYRDRPGVCFFSLEAASLLAVKAARWGWGLPYFHATMSLERDGDAIAYTSRRRGDANAQITARYRPGRMLGASPPGTFAAFLLERYLLFAVRGESIYEGQVVHTPYPAQEVEDLSIDEGLIAAAGLARPQAAPEIAHYASGVDVEVFGPHRVSEP